MSSRRVAAIALLIASPLLAACGSSGGDAGSIAAPAPPATDPATDTPATAETPSGGGGIAGALIAGAGGIDDASSASCDLNRQTLETAVLAFQAVNGVDPTTQDDLVGSFVVEAVPGFEIAAGGTVQPLPGGACIGH